LIDALDRRLHLLKVHLPYHESDHVLNIAYNALCGGTCLEDLELRRNDEVYLDALGAQRIPDPTTAGDFCRRFAVENVEALQEAVNEVRLGVWRRQPTEFFERATLDVDGSLAPTTGQCKQGMGLAHDGTWGYHPLIVSLANTQEPLYLSNRGGNRPSHEGAAAYLDRAIALCRRAGFQSVRLRGDTDFSQTTHLDRWDDADDVTFVFGLDAMRNLVERANEVPKSAWKKLPRAAKYEVKTEPRARPQNVKERIVVEKGYKNLKLLGEHAAEFAYRPTACARHYRVLVLRKKLSVEQGQHVLFEDYRYFFYISNDRSATPAELIFEANGRCNQENLIEQLKNGVRALAMPVDNLLSNWAYMVMAALAWSLKAWFALSLPEPGGAAAGVAPQALGRWGAAYREQKRQVLTMEFKRFVNAFLRVPCQIVRTGRRIVSPAGLEPVAGGVRPRPGGPGPPVAVLNTTLDAGIRTSRSTAATNQRKRGNGMNLTARPTSPARQTRPSAARAPRAIGRARTKISFKVRLFWG
jgi:hypothetical protein